MYVVVDLEATNALNGNSDRRIIQIGMTFIDNRQIQDTLCFDINPDVPISSKITELTGITDEQVANAPLFEEIAEYIYTLLEGCVFVAHNVQFDYSLLKKEFNRVGFTHFNMPNLDTIELAKIMFPYEKSYSLKNLAESKCILHQHHHNAGSDALATAELFLLLLHHIDQLDDHVSENIYYVLSHKEDIHASLFKQATYFNPITYTIQTSESLIKEAKGKLADNVISLLRQNKHPLLPSIDFEQLACVANQLLILVPHEKSMLDIQQQLKTAYCLQKSGHYINIEQLTACLQHLSLFTIQEVRQLCVVLVWLTMSKTGCLAEIDLSDKLMYQLSLDGHVNNHSVYLQHVNQLHKHSIILMYQCEFIQQIHLWEKQLNFKALQLCIVDLYAWCKSLEYTQMQIVYNGKHLFDLLKYKQKLQYKIAEKESMALVEQTSKIEHIIEEYKWLVCCFMRKYPNLFQGTDKEGNYAYFIDELKHIDTFWFIRFKHALEQFKALVEAERSLSYELHEALTQQINHLTQLITCPTEQTFLVLEKQYNKYVTYQLFAQNIAYEQWMKEHIYNEVSQLIYISKINAKQIKLVSYLQKYINDPQLVVLDQPNDDKTPMLVQVNPIIATKENLFVKKVNTYLQKISQMCIVIVPSKRMLKKLMELNEELTMLSQQSMKSSIVVMTWKEWQEKQIDLKTVKKVIITKLPFESPDSLEAIISKNYLLAKNETYFKDIALPKMLFILFECVQTCMQRGISIDLLDNRVLESVYAHDIQTTLANICLFKVLNIATKLD